MASSIGKYPICLQIAMLNISPVGLNTNNNMVFNCDVSLPVVFYYGNNLSYSLYDIIPGMWVAGGIGGYAWRVSSVIGIGSDINGNSIATLLLEDLDNSNYIISDSNSYSPPSDPAGSQIYLLFQLNSNGVPILQGLYGNYLNGTLLMYLPEIISRFSY